MGLFVLFAARDSEAVVFIEVRCRLWGGDLFSYLEGEEPLGNAYIALPRVVNPLSRDSRVE